MLIHLCAGDGVDEKPLDESTSDYLFLLMECLRLLIERNPSNTDLFRCKGGSQCTYQLILSDNARQYALRIVQQLIVDGGHDDLGTLSYLKSTLYKYLQLGSKIFLCIYSISVLLLLLI